jgi:hypothetical protein
MIRAGQERCTSEPTPTLAIPVLEQQATGSRQRHESAVSFAQRGMRRGAKSRTWHPVWAGEGFREPDTLVGDGDNHEPVTLLALVDFVCGARHDEPGTLFWLVNAQAR